MLLVDIPPGSSKDSRVSKLTSSGAVREDKAKVPPYNPIITYIYIYNPYIYIYPIYNTTLI